MKKVVFILLASVLSLAALARTVRLTYGEFDTDLRQLADFEDIELLKIKLTVDSVGGEYDLVAVTVTPDSIIEQLISSYMPVKLGRDSIEFNVFAKPLGSDSVRIQLAGSNYQPHVHKVPTWMCILFNCVAQTEFNSDEEIPLFAYAPGAEYEMEFNGQKVRGYQYCQVRDSGKHPSQWGKTFSLPPYIYYTLPPKK